MIETTGEALVLDWDRRHPIGRDCPGCGDPTVRNGITLLAYTFERCGCDRESYEHLVETLWHRTCLQPVVCEEFRPFHVRAVRGTPAHDTVECHVCGRTERTHP